MRKRTEQDQHLDQLLPLAIRQMMEEAASSLPPAEIREEDVYRADRAFQAALCRCIRQDKPTEQGVNRP